MQDLFLTVTDVKEMGYCARIVYYRYCLPSLQPPATFKMQAGVEANEKTEALEHRRSLRAYGLGSGRREYDVWLESAALGLRGRLDMLITIGDAPGSIEVIPVDFKNAQYGAPEQDGDHPAHHSWQLQLAAYALLAEEQRSCRVSRGFIYLIPQRESRLVELGEPMQQEVRESVDRIHRIIASERMPEASIFPSRCAACEYRLFCNDV